MQKILVVRFSSIGDIVLTSPVVRCLKKQLNAEVHFLTKKSFQPLVASNPNISKVLTLGDSLSKTLREVRAEKYDVVIDLHHNFRTFWVKLFSGSKCLSFQKLNVEKWLLVHFRINRLPDKHIVDRYLATCAALGVHNDGAGLDYYFPDEDAVDTAALIGSSAPFIAWVAGAKFQTKKFPVSKIIETLQRSDFPKLPVVFIGGKEDAGEAAAVINDYNGPLQLINSCGRFNLNQSASVVQQSAAVIANDTGLMHIAAAFKKPIISIWGNTIPEFGMTPYYGNHPVAGAFAEVKNLGCRPCSKIGFPKCPCAHFKCMQHNELPLQLLQQI